jgi:cytochrome P450
MSGGTTEVPDPQPPGSAAEASGWDLYSIARSEDPHARWRAIREAHPVLDAGEGVWFVSSWSAVDGVLRDPALRAGSGVAASFGDAGGRAARAMRLWLMSLDGEAQTRARGLVRRDFTPRAIATLEPRVCEITQALVEAMRPEDGTRDLIADLAFALPSQVIRSLFGFSVEDWRKEVESVIRGIDDRPGASLEMIESLAHFFEARLAAEGVPDGLLTALQRPDSELGALSRDEVVANAVLLVTAAIDTTAGLIGNAIHCLLDRPEIVEAIRQERLTLDAVVEETLRFEPPALSCTRSTVEPLEIEGIPVPAGAQLLLGLAAASRDPLRYPDPDRFDPGRPPGGLLAFGGGRHVCLGAALARLEARIALDALFLQAPFEIERVSPPTWQTKNPTVRALERLPVRLSARPARKESTP